MSQSLPFTLLTFESRFGHKKICSPNKNITFTTFGFGLFVNLDLDQMVTTRLLNKLLISELDYQVRCHVCLNVCMCATIIKSLPHAMLDGRTGQLPLLPKKY